jgi:hypothetical protein
MRQPSLVSALNARSVCRALAKAVFGWAGTDVLYAGGCFER